MEEANQQIPWLEPRLRQIVALRQELARLHRDFQWLLLQSRSNGHTGVEAQIAAKRQ